MESVLIKSLKFVKRKAKNGTSVYNALVFDLGSRQVTIFTNNENYQTILDLKPSQFYDLPVDTSIDFILE